MFIELVPARLAEFETRKPEIARGIRTGFDNFDEGSATLAEVLSTLEPRPRPSPWNAYWALDREEPCYVGLCGFKASPDLAQIVEIAYFTFPRREGRGVARQMAASLVAIARSAGVIGVVAHTLPQENASVSVLKRLGFRATGTIIDPDDGEIWSWRIDLNTQRRTSRTHLEHGKPA